MENMNYNLLLKQIESLTATESNLIANLANTTSILHDELKVLWTGFYFVENDELVLGPFQGPVACTRIGFGKGVCGKSWESEELVCVDDVHKFPGHIACSSRANSEIVIPIKKNGKVTLVLDIDSEDYARFNSNDISGLQAICSYLETII